MKRESIYESATLDVDWLPEHDALYMTYKGKLVYEASQRAYQIGTDMVIQRGQDGINGIIGDFRQVTDFPNTNIRTVQKNSKQVHKEHDMSKFGVALLVENMMQEMFVKVTMEASNTSGRSQLVRSVDEAFEFLEQYRAQHTKPDNLVSDKETL